jgi:uncharacterized protein (TIGR02271 family)
MLTDNDVRQVIGATAYGDDGDKIGKVGQVFLDDETGKPEFVTVNTGLFGTKETFIPVQSATFNGDRLQLPFSKDKVKDAPNVDADEGHLDRPEEQRLYEYYGLTYGGSGFGNDDRSGVAATGDNLTGTDLRGNDTDATDLGRGSDFSGGNVQGEGHDTSGPTTDEAMTRSEEHLEVGKTTQEVGRARLRKYVTTEQETHTVPVRKEKAVLEREPITDANRGEALDGPAISDEEHEVVLNEERVEVSKTTEPVERVRLGTETVTDEETVTEEVRKEHIDTEGDIADRT